MEVYLRLYDRITELFSPDYFRDEIILPEDKFIRDLGFDSLDLVEFLVWAEEVFDIEINDNECDTDDKLTVAEFADLIETKVNIE